MSNILSSNGDIKAHNKNIYFYSSEITRQYTNDLRLLNVCIITLIYIVTDIKK